MTRWKFTASLLLGSMLLVGCGNAGSSASAEKIVRIGEHSDIASMDMAVATDMVSLNTMNSVMEGLYTKDLEGKTIPALAVGEPTVSADGLVYTFTLNDKAKWSDGSLVTAKDFVYAWKRMVDPELASGYGYMYENIIKNATAIMAGEKGVDDLGVKALSDTQLEVTLEQPTSFFLDLLALPFYFPLNEAFVTSQGDKYGTSSDTLLYNGPFVLEGWDAAKGGTWTLKKNTNYYNPDAIQVDQVAFQVIATESTGVNLFDSGQLDLLSLLGSPNLDQYRSRPEFESHVESTSNFIELNHTNPVFANQNIRKALAYAINIGEFTEQVLKDGSIPVGGYVPKGLASNPSTGVDFREESGVLTSFDKAIAQEAWQAGLDELGLDKFETSLMVSDTDNSMQLAAFIQEQLQTNLPGLTVTIQPVPFKLKQSNIRSGEFEMATSNWIADIDDPVNYVERFHSSVNRGQYSFTDVDALIDQAKASYDDLEKRWELLVQAEQKAIGEYYVQIPLHQGAIASLQSDRIDGVYVPTFGPESYRYLTVKEGN